MGMEFRPYYFGREWAKMGHRVDIIAADFSHIRRKNQIVAHDFDTEDIDGITYHWVKTRKYSGNGAARAVTMIEFVSKLRRNAKRIIDECDPDIILCSSTYPLDTYAGQKLRRVSGRAKLIHEAHDMWPATLVEIGKMARTNPFVVMMQIAENSAYRNSDYVISMAPYTEDYMKDHGLADGKWIHVPLGIDMNEWRERKPLSEDHMKHFRKLHDDGNFVVGYFGGLALSNAMDNFLDIASIFLRKDEKASFVIVGKGVEKEHLMRRVEDEGLTNVSFLPPVSKKEIPELTAQMDCIYMGANATSLYRFGLCLNKMADSMMAQRPVLCAITAPPTWVDIAGCGITTDSANAGQAAGAIKKIMDMTEEERRAMAVNGRRYAEQNLDIKKLAERTADLFMSLNGGEK